MEFEDDAFVLSARPFGETGAIVELVTRAHGKYAAHVAGAASRRMKPFLQAGARVTVRYRARTSEQLGAATLEPAGGHRRCSTMPWRWRAWRRPPRWWPRRCRSVSRTWARSWDWRRSSPRWQRQISGRQSMFALRPGCLPTWAS